MTYTEEQLWPGLRVTLIFYFCADADQTDYIVIPYTFSVPMGAEFCEHFFSSHGTAAMCMAQDAIGPPCPPHDGRGDRGCGGVGRRAGGVGGVWEELAVRRIYLASSWRNKEYPYLLAELRRQGHEVYDFREPQGKPGLDMSKVDPEWRDWTPEEALKHLRHPTLRKHFAMDKKALEWCNTCVVLLPCGKSAHLEVGWAAGAKKATAALVRPYPRFEVELMYKLLDFYTTETGDLLKWLTML